MYTIIGSGFGLYGYLPAIVEGFGETVVLPRAYEGKVRARVELANTLTNIHWAKDEDVGLSQATTVVIATTPQRQFETVLRCVSLLNIEKLILEKPIAATPAQASILVERLGATGKRYRIGFTFLYTSWHKQLEWSKLLFSTNELYFTWTFKADHFVKDLDTWKRNRTEGGGVLRFYGIHLVALLASKGYDGVRESKIEGDRPDEPLRWRALFTGVGLPNCHVFVDSLCVEKRFEISQNHDGHEQIIISATSPFESERSPQCADSRIGSLVGLINSFDENDEDFKLYYTKVINLWALIEDM
jgi:hypothetical protein